ncbi:MAG: sporulation protein YabP [Syntrophomonadaceae bacterium]|jgi:sporulation protein YabP
MSDHTIRLVNRKNMELTGINNVNTFDEQLILLETGMGLISISGQDLHITKLNLDEGKVDLEGSINSVEYKAQGADVKTKGKNILNRLLK